MSNWLRAMKYASGGITPDAANDYESQLAALANDPSLQGQANLQRPVMGPPRPAMTPKQVDDYTAQLGMLARDTASPNAATTQPTPENSSVGVQAPSDMFETDPYMGMLTALANPFRGFDKETKKKIEERMLKQQENADYIQKLAKEREASIKQENDRPDFSPLAQLTDSLFGSNISKSYKAPLSQSEQKRAIAEAQGEAAKAEQPIISDLLKEQSSDVRGMLGAGRGGAAQDRYVDGLESKFAHAMNPLTTAYGSGLNNLGQKLVRARSVDLLLKSMDVKDPFNLDVRQMKDVAIGMAALATNQNRVPVEIVESLMPHTFKGTAAQWLEYVMNKPYNTDSQDFVKRMMKTIYKERQGATEQIAAIQRGEAERFQPLMKYRPQAYKRIWAKRGEFTNIPSIDAPLPGATPAGGGGTGMITLYDPVSKKSKQVPDSPDMRKYAADKKFEVR